MRVHLLTAYLHHTGAMVGLVEYVGITQDSPQFRDAIAAHENAQEAVAAWTKVCFSTTNSCSPFQFVAHLDPGQGPIARGRSAEAYV